MTPCIQFAGTISDQGYGRIYIGAGKWRRAHRMVWLLAGRTIPDGMQLDHLCRNRACVNLDHLELVTSKQNTLRGVGPTAKNARKEYCPNRHGLHGINLRTDKRGRRSCKTCQKVHDQKYKSRKKAALAAVDKAGS